MSESTPVLAAELSRGPLGDWRDRLIEETKWRLGFPRMHGSALPDQVAAFRSRLTVKYVPPSTWVNVSFRAYDSAANLGDRHPEIVSLRSELDLTRGRLDARLESLKEATTRDFRMATREEIELKREVANVKRRLARIEGKSVEQGFIQQRAEAGQQAVGELIAKSVRQSDEEVFFAPRVLQQPESTTTPASPQRARNFQYALALGLLAGLGLAWLLAHLDETIKTPEDVKFNVGVPLLGVVPKIPAPQFDPLASEEGESARLAEVYRVLRTNLVLGAHARPGSQVVLITSSREGEGKTSTSCGLAVALARGGHKVLLVDGDLRRASLSRLLSATGQKGVSDAVGGAPPSECIVTTSVEGLSLMPSGTPRRTPGQLLNGEALPDIIKGLRSSYDWILCDAPPVLAVADATILCRMVDSVIVVIGANATPLGSIRATLDQLNEVGGALRGVVLNRVDLDRDSHYYKYYYASHYAYYSSNPEGEADSEAPPATDVEGEPQPAVSPVPAFDGSAATPTGKTRSRRAGKRRG